MRVSLDLLRRKLSELDTLVRTQIQHAENVTPLLTIINRDIKHTDAETVDQIGENIHRREIQVQEAGRALLETLGLSEIFNPEDASKLKQELSGLSNDELKQFIELLLKLDESNTLLFSDQVMRSSYGRVGMGIFVELMGESVKSCSLNSLINTLVEILTERANKK